jgi:hypothetical protein
LQKLTGGESNLPNVRGESLGPQGVQLSGELTKGSRASGDLTKVQERAKRIAESRLVDGNVSSTVAGSSVSCASRPRGGTC